MWQAFNTDKQKKKEERVAYTCSLKPRDLLYIFCFPINFHAFPAHKYVFFNEKSVLTKLINLLIAIKTYEIHWSNSTTEENSDAN
jgi:hypothetical protein